MPIPKMQYEGVELMLLPKALKKTGLFGRQIVEYYKIKTRWDSKKICFLKLMDGQYFEALQEKKHKKKTLEELCNSNWLLVKEVKIIDSSIKKSFIKYLEEYYYDNDYYFMDYIAKKIRIDNKILSKLGGEYCERKELKEYTPLSAGVSVKGRRYKVFDALEVILCDPCKYYFGIGYFKQALREKNFQQPVL